MRAALQQADRLLAATAFIDLGQSVKPTRTAVHAARSSAALAHNSLSMAIWLQLLDPKQQEAAEASVAGVQRWVSTAIDEDLPPFSRDQLERLQTLFGGIRR